MYNYNLLTPLHSASKNGDYDVLKFFILDKLNEND